MTIILPSFSDIPIYVSIDVGVGYLYGKLIQKNPSLTATLFAIRTLTDAIFYHIANYALEGKDLQSQKIFLVTSTLVNIAFFFILRELHLMGQLFSCLFGTAIIGRLMHRMRYIKEQEVQLMVAEEMDEIE